MLAHPDAAFSPLVADIQARLTPAPAADTTTSKPTVSESEACLKDSRNFSTASLMSLGSQGEAKHSAATSEVEEGMECQDSDGEDAGLPMGSVSVGSVGNSGVAGTLTPSVSPSGLNKLAMTPGKPANMSSAAAKSATTTPHTTNVDTSTDFDSLFSAPTTSVTSSSSKVVVVKKIKTSVTTSAATCIASSGSSVTAKKSDKKLVTTSAATSVTSASVIKVKNKDGERKEKKDKNSGKNERCGDKSSDKSKKRKSETADDIDDIFGF